MLHGLKHCYTVRLTGLFCSLDSHFVFINSLFFPFHEVPCPCGHLLPWLLVRYHLNWYKCITLIFLNFWYSWVSVTCLVHHNDLMYFKQKILLKSVFHIWDTQWRLSDFVTYKKTWDVRWLLFSKHCMSVLYCLFLFAMALIQIGASNGPHPQIAQCIQSSLRGNVSSCVFSHKKRRLTKLMREGVLENCNNYREKIYISASSSSPLILLMFLSKIVQCKFVSGCLLHLYICDLIFLITETWFDSEHEKQDGKF